MLLSTKPEIHSDRTLLLTLDLRDVAILPTTFSTLISATLAVFAQISILWNTITSSKSQLLFLNETKVSSNNVSNICSIPSYYLYL